MAPEAPSEGLIIASFGLRVAAFTGSAKFFKSLGKITLVEIT